MLMVPALIGACAPQPPADLPAPAVGLPPVPAVDGVLDIRVAHPTAGSAKPGVDSTFIFGTVGTGQAELAINGTPVTVARNGAFLAYLPVPQSGEWVLEARKGALSRDREVVAYRPPPPPAPAAPPLPAKPVATVFPVPRVGVVTGGADTLATGSAVAYGMPTPTADRRWFFPRGARLPIVERRGDLLRARLADGVDAWLSADEVTLEDPAPMPAAPVGAISIRPADNYVDVRIPLNRAPFLIHAGEQSLGVTVYGRTAAPVAMIVADTLLLEAAWRPAPGDSAHLDLQLARRMWGYKAFYDADGALVLRIRRPPRIDEREPFRGLRVLLDAGHPPGGAIGPTGLTEAEANLGIVLRVAEELRRRGAEVLLTRATDAPLVSATNTSEELHARVALAVRADADLLVSIHNNAFGEGVNPFRSYGTETYYFHPFSADLARALDAEIVGVTRIPDLGAKRRSLALVRPTWMPSALTESLFMMFPEQEAALRNPTFLDRLAAAHVRGMEAFLRTHAAVADRKNGSRND